MNGLKFITAKFVNNDRTTVESLWEDEEGNLVSSYNEAIDGDPIWEEVKENISIDAIHENTFNYIRSSQEEYKKQVLQFAKQDGLIYDIKDTDNSIYKIMIEKLFKPCDAVADKEDLFLIKLQLFELDVIKKCQDRQKKMELRKATTIIEAIRVGLEIAEGRYNTEEEEKQE